MMILCQKRAFLRIRLLSMWRATPLKWGAMPVQASGGARAWVRPLKLLRRSRLCL